MLSKKKKKDIKNANIVKDEEGRQYHIGLKKGELAENIVLVGDPARPDRVKDLFSEIDIETYVREFHTITGRIGELDISVMSTGIGPPNIETKSAWVVVPFLMVDVIPPYESGLGDSDCVRFDGNGASICVEVC